MNTIGIAGYGFYDIKRIGGSSGRSISGSPSIDTVKWRDVSDSPFKRFGQLDALSKASMIATEMIGQDQFPTAEHELTVGISLGTQEGCLGTDIDFRASALEREIANPRLFAYTLPSTICGDIAIRYGLCGPNACFQYGPRSGSFALEEGYHLIESGEADACLCIGVDALFSKSALTAAAHDMLPDEHSFSAYAFLLARNSGASTPLLCTISATKGTYCVGDSNTSLKELCAWMESIDGQIPVLKLGRENDPI